MRRETKRQILDLMTTMEEAISYLQCNSQNSQKGLLRDSSLCAQSIAATLQKESEAQGKCIHLLAQFMEKIIQAQEQASDLHAFQQALSAAKIKLAFLRRKMEKIPVKLEVVFFPYKASMADSLQSIWEAAIEDLGCDVIICPIPYFDRLSDGTFGEMHYEGDAYAADLPLVHWQAYDVEARHPDVIFIHAPYDEYNAVTSVHPDFYSKRLRTCTEMLVYVPYFVVPRDVSEHLCTVAGCVHAHKTIVQSESVRDTYIRAFERKFGDRFGDPREKFIALGSPKFDKVIHAKREQYLLPEKWEQLIAEKKVVLYNTSLGAILQGDEQYLFKQQKVLDVFRKRKDAVLWWRPHPLTESTFESMRPALADTYRKITGKYKEEAYGIYDDSTDVNRAVVYADYYYGDCGSAVEAVFLATGKPIMLQRIGVMDESLVLPVILGTDGSRLFFSPLYSTAIMSLDLIRNRIQIVKQGHSTVKRAYSLGVNSVGTLYFTPVAEDRILIFDTKADTFTYIPFELNQRSLSHMNPKYKTGSNFLMSYEYNETIFFVGCYYPGIMCYNTKDGVLTYKTEWPKVFKGGEFGITFTWSCQMDATIVLVGTSSIVLFFDMETKQFTTENIFHKSAANGFSTVAYGDGFLWLMSKEDGTILKFNPKSKVIREYNDFPVGVNRCKTMCLSSIYVRGYLWLFSDQTNAVLRVHAESGRISVVRMFPNAAIGDAVHLGLPILVGNKIYASLLNDPGLTAYDVETGSYTELLTNVEQNAANMDREPTDVHEAILMENGFDTISTLLNTSPKNNKKLLNKWIESPDGTAGEKIYDYVKKAILQKKESKGGAYVLCSKASDRERIAAIATCSDGVTPRV